MKGGIGLKEARSNHSRWSGRTLVAGEASLSLFFLAVAGHNILVIDYCMLTTSQPYEEKGEEEHEYAEAGIYCLFD